MTEKETSLYTPVNIPPARNETITGLFLKRISRTPQAIGYRFYDKNEQSWQDKTWQETANEVGRWQHAMIAEGLNKGDRIAIMGQNSWHWIIADQAALGLGLVVVPLYVNDQADDAFYIIRNSGARILVIDGEDEWQLLKDKLINEDQLLRVISIHDFDTEDEKLIRASTWLPQADRYQIENKVSHKNLASIVYTSGTTGIPKGVMLSHGNIVSNVSSCMQAVPVYSSDTFLSFLPLSHMLERTVGYYLPILGGSIVAFTRGIPFLPEDIKFIKPTRLISVPRIYERIHAKLNSRISEKPGFIKFLYRHAVNIGWESFNHRQGRVNWSPRFLWLPVLNLLFARRLQQQMGGRLISAICGGAPLSSEIAKTFIGLGIPLLQGYGLTEASPVVSVNRLDNNIPSSIGLPLAGFHVKTDEHDELLVRGDSVMQGYWCDNTGTAETIDSDGWLHTGDIAKIENSFIYITGRLKEIIVLSTGEKVSPIDMEMAISSDPLFEQVMVIGEGCPYLTAVAVIDEDYLENEKQTTEDMEKLLLEKIAQQLHQFPSYEQVRRVYCSTEKWTVENEMLTPTFKLKRNNILDKYKEEIAGLYEGHAIYGKENSILA
jgi:long-chain acyl-CoA synthetase